MTDTTQQEREALLPCPFCGAGETRFDHSNMWTGTRNQLVCVRIRHWCEKPMQTNFEVKGNTEAEAIAAWNRRATPQGAEPAAEGKTVPENATGLLQECASALARTGGMMNKDLAKVVTKFLSDLER